MPATPTENPLNSADLESRSNNGVELSNTNPTNNNDTDKPSDTLSNIKNNMKVAYSKELKLEGRIYCYRITLVWIVVISVLIAALVSFTSQTQTILVISENQNQ